MGPCLSKKPGRARQPKVKKIYDIVVDKKRHEINLKTLDNSKQLQFKVYLENFKAKFDDLEVAPVINIKF